MAIPGTNIRLSGNIALELGLATSSIMKISDVYAVSQTAGQVSSGSYHNLTIGSGSGNTFANLIYAPYVANADLKLVNWVNYDHDRNNIFSLDITNNTPNDYDVFFYLSISPGGFTIPIGSWTVVGGGTNVNVQDYNTGIPAYTSFGTPASPYFVDCEVVYTGGAGVGGCIMVVTVAFDSDNVGAGLSRSDYTATNGPYNLAPVSGTDFKDCLISGAGAFMANGIEWNKRTSVQMVIT
jgi:hypothetical protein